MLRGEGDLTVGTDAAGLARIRQQADAAGVGIFSLAMLHAADTPVMGGDAQQRCVDQLAAGLGVAKALGADNTLLTLGRITPDLYYDVAYANAVATLRQLGPIAEQIGVDVAIEFVWNGFLFSPMEMKRFLDEVGHPRIGFYFDPGNMAVFQVPQHWVRIIGKHTKKVHLKDWTGGPLNGKWTGLLAGGCDFPAIMAELRAIGYDGPLVSEVEPNLASLVDTVAAIRKIAAM
jgi:hexulose-6-phosphate isomerase